MEPIEAATQLTVALVGKTQVTEMTTDKSDQQSSAKWVCDAYKTIMIGVMEAIKEANKHR